MSAVKPGAVSRLNTHEISLKVSGSEMDDVTMGYVKDFII